MAYLAGGNKRALSAKRRVLTSPAQKGFNGNLTHQQQRRVDVHPGSL